MKTIVLTLSLLLFGIAAYAGPETKGRIIYPDRVEEVTFLVANTPSGPHWGIVGPGTLLNALLAPEYYANVVLLKEPGAKEHPTRFGAVKKVKYRDASGKKRTLEAAQTTAIALEVDLPDFTGRMEKIEEYGAFFNVEYKGEITLYGYTDMITTTSNGSPGDVNYSAGKTYFYKRYILRRGNEALFVPIASWEFDTPYGNLAFRKLEVHPPLLNGKKKLKEQLGNYFQDCPALAEDILNKDIDFLDDMPALIRQYVVNCGQEVPRYPAKITTANGTEDVTLLATVEPIHQALVYVNNAGEKVFAGPHNVTALEMEWEGGTVKWESLTTEDDGAVFAKLDQEGALNLYSYQHDWTLLQESMEAPQPILQRANEAPLLLEPTAKGRWKVLKKYFADCPKLLKYMATDRNTLVMDMPKVVELYNRSCAE